jgi:hypothetical protein
MHMSDSLQEAILRALRDIGAEFIGAGLVLVIILILVFVFYFLMRRLSSQRGVNIRLEWNSDRGQPINRTIENTSDVQNESQNVVSRPSQSDGLRRTLVIVYRGLVLMGATALLFGAIWAYMSATPGNGLLLVALLLFALSLIAFLSFGKYGQEASGTGTNRSTIDALLSNVKVSTSFATPEVHTLDNSTITRARTMMQQGASLDEICRTVDAQYATWDHVHQQAFQRVIQAALKA